MHFWLFFEFLFFVFFVESCFNSPGGLLGKRLHCQTPFMVMLCIHMSVWPVWLPVRWLQNHTPSRPEIAAGKRKTMPCPDKQEFSWTLTQNWLSDCSCYSFNSNRSLLTLTIHRIKLIWMVLLLFFYSWNKLNITWQSYTTEHPCSFKKNTFFSSFINVCLQLNKTYTNKTVYSINVWMFMWNKICQFRCMYILSLGSKFYSILHVTRLHVLLNFYLFI